MAELLQRSTLALAPGTLPPPWRLGDLRGGRGKRMSTVAARLKFADSVPVVRSAITRFVAEIR